MQKIGEIKSEIQAAEPGEYAALFEKYKEDTSCLLYTSDAADEL